MMLWIIFAVMTAAAVFAVLRPLGRRPAAAGGGSDRAVYQDQLQEIDRDRAAGLIGEAEAVSARHRAAAIAAIVIVPAVALGFYLKLGSPDVPGQSAFARADTLPGDQ